MFNIFTDFYNRQSLKVAIGKCTSLQNQDLKNVFANLCLVISEINN